MKKIIRQIAAAAMLSFMLCSCAEEDAAPAQDNTTFAQVHCGLELETNQLYAIKTPDELSRNELQAIVDAIHSNNSDMVISLEQGENESCFTTEDSGYYGSWKIIKLLSVKEIPYNYNYIRHIFGGPTNKMVKYGYEFDTQGNRIYHYALLNRRKYDLIEAARIITDIDGNRLWLDENGEILRSDEDSTQWETVEEITSEKVVDCWENETERCILIDYEISEGEPEDEYDKMHLDIIFHYVRQTRELLYD